MSKTDTMHDLLRSLVACQTIDGNTGANHSAVAFVDSYLRSRGLEPEIITHGGYQNLFVNTLGNKQPKVLLAAHIDVVPAPEQMFDMRIADGKLYGRGVYDMKFSIAAYLSVVDELQDRLQEFDFGIMITPDEEVGSPNGVPRLLEAGYVPTDVCVLPDGADRQNWNIETFAKGAWFGEFTATGVRAHGSRPWLGDNAIDKLLAFISDARTLFPPVSKDVSTLTIGQILGGEAINQVPESATVKFDMRFPSIEEKERLRAGITKLCAKHSITSNDVMYVDPTINDFENEYLQAFAAAVKKVTGVTSEPSNTPAGTDARFFAAHGLPVIICTPPGGSHHSDNEWIDEQGFLHYKDVVIDFLERTARV